MAIALIPEEFPMVLAVFLVGLLLPAGAEDEVVVDGPELLA